MMTTCSSCASRKKEQVALAREVGLTDHLLAPMLNDLVFKPLAALTEQHADGLIDHAELNPRGDDKGRDKK